VRYATIVAPESQEGLKPLDKWVVDVVEVENPLQNLKKG
jgi:hypothetical protein